MYLNLNALRGKNAQAKAGTLGQGLVETNDVIQDASTVFLIISPSLKLRETTQNRNQHFGEADRNVVTLISLSCQENPPTGASVAEP